MDAAYNQECGKDAFSNPSKGQPGSNGAKVMQDINNEEPEDIASPKLESRIAAKACIFKDSRMLVLFKPEDARKRSAVPDRIEDLPGGCVEKGESLQEALVREVLEETGLTIDVGRPFSAWHIDTPVRTILGVDFLAHWVSGEVQLSWEHESYAWMTLEELMSTDWEMKPVYEEAFHLVGL